MTRLSASIWIAAPPEQVFPIIASPPGPLLPAGGPRLLVMGPPAEVGTTYRWEYRRVGVQFRVDSEVAECHPGRLLLFRGRSGWQMEAQVELHPESGGTRLCFHVRYRFNAPARWLVPGALIRLGVWHALRRVKAMTEGGEAVQAVSI